MISCVALVPLALALNAATPASRVRSRAVKLAIDSNTFASVEWTSLEIELDTMPVFTIVNEMGELFQQPPHAARYYVDPQAAEDACVLARMTAGNDQLDTMPVGLGAAFRADQEGNGILVSAMDDLQAAGADLDASPEGQSVPMFLCPALASDRLDSGGSVLPIFLSAADADSAVAQAYDGGTPLTVQTVSLEWAVDQYCNVPDSPTFRFMARSASVQLLRSLMGVGA